MNLDTIFSKTDAGLREVQTRTPGFPIRLRQLLILIDGHKRLDELLSWQPIAEELNKQLNQLLELKLITNLGFDDLRPPIARPVATTTIAASSLINSLPNKAALQQIRRIISMTDQSYLSNKLEFMLSDVYDVMSSAEELQFCIDRWQKAMKDAGHGSMVDGYLYQIKAAMSA